MKQESTIKHCERTGLNKNRKAAKSREQVSEQQIETVSRILYKNSFGFPFDEYSIDGMFDHAVQSGHMPCRRKAEQLIEALARARKEPAC